MSNLVVKVESGKLELNKTTSMDPTSFGRVYLNEKKKSSRCQLVKNIACFIRTREENFSYWRNQQKSWYEQSRQTRNYHWYHRNSKQKYNHSPSTNLSETPSTGASSKVIYNNNRYAVRSGPTPSNQTSLKN